MIDFLASIQSDELMRHQLPYRKQTRPSQPDNDKRNDWQDREDDLQQPQDDYVWDDDAIAWEEGFHPDNLYPQ
jgi:hypothetical protein